MTPQSVMLALLVFALIVTRPLEERRWRSGRISDRGSAILVVGRLPFLAIGFALITAREPGAVLLMGAIALVAAAVLYPFVVRRLRRLSGHTGNTVTGPGRGGPPSR